jgi:hypothetical protein
VECVRNPSELLEINPSSSVEHRDMAPAYIRTEPIWNSKCLLVIASRNRKVFLLREKAVGNFRTTFLIALKAEELESFRMNLAFRLGPVCSLIRNRQLSTKFLCRL